MGTLRARYPSDLSLRLLALVLAVALWFVAAEEQRSRQPEAAERVVPATVRLDGVAPDLVAVGVPSAVEVRLRLPAGVRAPEQLDAYVDVSGRRAGEHRVDVRVQVPQSALLIGTLPAQLTVRLEREISRTLPVDIAVVGLPAGVAVSVYPPEPPSATLMGAESRVGRVARVVAAVTYDEGGLDVMEPVRPLDSRGGEVAGVVVRPRQVRVVADGVAPSPPVGSQPSTRRPGGTPPPPPGETSSQP